VPRVVKIGTKIADISDIPPMCPMGAFKKGPNGELVIDHDACVDCGACQSMAPDGVIVSDSDADEKTVKYNNDNADKWDKA